MEKSSNKTIVISIFLGLVCIAILGLIVYFKINNKNEQEPVEVPENIETSEQVLTSETKEEPESKENYEEIVKNLYAIIGTNPEFRYTEIVNFESLSESVRDSIVLNSLNENCIETVSYAKDLFLTKYKEIFNQEKTSDEGLCKLDGANYECSRYCSEFGETIYNQFEKYELVEDSIVIYENAGHLDHADDGKVYLKENAIDSEAIASFETTEDLKNSEVQYKLPIYKHVFNKNDDGNYYWVSSESVKQ